MLPLASQAACPGTSLRSSPRDSWGEGLWPLIPPTSTAGTQMHVGKVWWFVLQARLPCVKGQEQAGELPTS